MNLNFAQGNVSLDLNNATPKHHILLLEANNDWRELLQFPLAEMGYAVQGCATVGAAWSFVARHPRALVIAGERIGGLDGISTMAVLKEHFPELRCMAVVENLEAWNKRAVAWLDAFVFKPLDMTQLLQIVTDLTGSRKGNWRGHSVWTRAKQLLGQSRRWVSGLWLRWRLRRVERWRYRCFGEFFRQVHSGAMGTGGALQAWDELEHLDGACASASLGKVDCTALGDGFRLLCEFMTTRAVTRCFWNNRRDPQAVSCQDLTRLMKRIRADVITVDQLCDAPTLRRCLTGKGKESPDYLAVWGKEEDSVQPWAGARETLDRKLVPSAWRR